MVLGVCCKILTQEVIRSYRLYSTSYVACSCPTLFMATSLLLHRLKIFLATFRFDSWPKITQNITLLCFARENLWILSENFLMGVSCCLMVIFLFGVSWKVFCLIRSYMVAIWPNEELQISTIIFFCSIITEWRLLKINVRRNFKIK